TARSTPRLTPIAIAMTVSSRVTTIPWRIRPKKRYCPTMRQSRVGAAINVYRPAAASARTTTADTHLPGWRSGMALMASGRVLPLEAMGSLTVAPDVRSRPHVGGHNAMRPDEGPQYDGTQLAP